MSNAQARLVSHFFAALTGWLRPCDILSGMNPHHIPWNAIVLVLIKFLKMFGIIPGAMAAFGVR